MFFQACGHMIKPVHTELDIKVFTRKESINAHDFYSVIIPSIGHSLEGPNPVGQSTEERGTWCLKRKEAILCVLCVVSDGECWRMFCIFLSLAQSLTHSPCWGPHVTGASPVGARQHGTSQAKVLTHVWWEELLRGIHSGQQSQHWGLQFTLTDSIVLGVTPQSSQNTGGHSKSCVSPSSTDSSQASDNTVIPLLLAQGLLLTHSPRPCTVLARSTFTPASHIYLLGSPEMYQPEMLNVLSTHKHVWHTHTHAYMEISVPMCT